VVSIPGGNINTLDRLQRLQSIRELKEEGKTDSEIANELGMALLTVKRNLKYLDELSTSDLSASLISTKRAELFLEALDASKEAQQMFQDNKEKAPQAANSWFLRWLDTIKLRMQLYGLDNVKIDSFTQVNQQFNTYTPERIDAVAGQKLADIIKRKHEEKLKLADAKEV
jgi:predicted transcriptional regulator